MIPELVHTLESSLSFVEKCVDDLTEQQMVEQPAGVPNHGAWTLGHLIQTCEGMATEMGAKSWLPEDWESIFGYGSTPEPDLSRYPKKSELLSLLADSADRLRQTLLAADDSALTKPLPDASLPTMAHLLLQVVVAHTAFHVGQLATWRRAIGMKSVGVFV